MANRLFSQIRSIILPNRRNQIQRQFNFQNAGYFTVGNVPAVVADIDAEKAIHDGYEGNATIYSIITAYSSKIAEAPRYLEEVNDDTVIGEKNQNKFIRKAIKDSGAKRDLQRLLNRPNEYESGRTFFAKMSASYKLWGEYFILLNRGDEQEFNDINLFSKDIMSKPILEMYVLPANFVAVIPDPTNLFGVLGYFFNINGQKRFYRKENIIHGKNVNLGFDPYCLTQLRGISPLKPGNKLLQLNDDVYLCILRMIQNDGSKDIITPKGSDPLDISPGQADAIQQRLDSKINNIDNKNSVAFMQFGIDHVALSRSPEMQLVAIKDSSVKDLCALFNIPYEKVESATTFNNKGTSFKGWVLDSIIPDCNKFDDEFNRYLPQAFGLTDVVISSDFSVYKELEDEVAERNKSLTINEQRIAQGYDPLPDPIYDQVLIMTNMLPANEIGAELQQINNPNVNRNPPQ